MPSGHHGGQTGPTRTQGQRQVDKILMLQLIRRGWSKQRIAGRLGVDPSEITYDFKQVLKELAKIHNIDSHLLRAKAMAELEELKVEAMEAWEKSKLPGEKEIVTEIETEHGVRTNVTRVKQGRLPQDSYLKLVRDCIGDERELQALDPPKKMVVGHTIAWDDLIAVPTPVDDVEAEIQLLESNKGAHIQPEQVNSSQGHPPQTDGIHAKKPRTNGEKDHK
jgi:hypothetical protein